MQFRVVIFFSLFLFDLRNCGYNEKKIIKTWAWSRFYYCGGVSITDFSLLLKLDHVRCTRRRIKPMRIFATTPQRLYCLGLVGLNSLCREQTISEKNGCSSARQGTLERFARRRDFNRRRSMTTSRAPILYSSTIFHSTIFHIRKLSLELFTGTSCDVIL